METVPVEGVRASVGKCIVRALAPRGWFSPPDNGGTLPWAVVAYLPVTFYFGSSSRAPRRTKHLRGKVTTENYGDIHPEEIEECYQKIMAEMQAQLQRHGIDQPLDFSIQPPDYPVVVKYEKEPAFLVDAF